MRRKEKCLIKFKFPKRAQQLHRVASTPQTTFLYRFFTKYNLSPNLLNELVGYINTYLGDKLNPYSQEAIEQELISNGLKTGEFYRQQQITNALYNLATSSFNSRYMKIDWQAWLELLDSSIDSKTLWDKAVKEQQSQLLHLIATGKLEFFHPYLPMTAEKHIQFRDYVVEQSKLAPQTQNSYNSLFSTSRPQRENKRGSSLTFFSRDLFFSPSEDKPPIDSTPAKTNIAKPGDRP